MYIKSTGSTQQKKSDLQVLDELPCLILLTSYNDIKKKKKINYYKLRKKTGVDRKWLEIMTVQKWVQCNVFFFTAESQYKVTTWRRGNRYS